jgi:aspartate aminotransferase
MPKISIKGQNMPASPIRKLVPYAEQAKKKGIEVIHLNIGQPDIQTPINALEAVKNNNIHTLAYSRSEGSDSYREKLAAYYKKHQVEVDPSDILVTTGGSEALTFTIGSIADPGDELIVPEPFYANYYGFSTVNGVNIVPITSNIEDNFEMPSILEFEKIITDKTKGILICNPGNPTGYLYTRVELESLIDLVNKHDIFLIVDEVYREFVYNHLKHHSLMSFANTEDCVILIDSVSKRYSMCGARVGCIVSKNKEVISTALKFAQTRLSPPTYAQIASEAALDAPDHYLLAVQQEYQRRRNTLIEALKDIPNIDYGLPNGAFYCVVELPINDADHFAQWLLEEYNLDGQTVMVAPAAGFYHTPGLGKNQIRIAYVLECNKLLTAVNIIKNALEVYPNP